MSAMSRWFVSKGVKRLKVWFLKPEATSETLVLRVIPEVIDVIQISGWLSFLDLLSTITFNKSLLLSNTDL